jgi:NTE family protein
VALPGDEGGTKRIAIDCQGGGVHSAFAAGALKRLLLREERHEVVALSGTSGGAICAFLAWYALLEDRTKAAEKAAELLDDFWRDNSASDPYARFWNDRTVWGSRLQGSLPTLMVSPYDTPTSSWIKAQLRMLLEKQRVDFGNLKGRVDPSSPVGASGERHRRHLGVRQELRQPRERDRRRCPSRL